MAKRITSLDTLGEVRRAMRILRRTERWLVQCERDQHRLAQRQRERDRERASAAEMAQQG